jgi:phage/plasmid-associated DNA primase
MDRIPQLIREHCVNNNWHNETQHSSLGKILFKNGYYDFHKELFYDKATYGFNPDIVFMGRIHHDFEPFDTDYIEDIKQRLFINPLGKELGEFLILNFARGLAGDMMKRILFGLGGTDGGKSVLTMALELACGDYYGTFNAANLCVKTHVNDEAQNLRWCLLLKSKRLILSSELKSDVNVDGNSLKKVSSGGDSLVARGHGANEQSFTPHFLAMVLANDIKKITPYDDAVNGRVQIFSYNKRFVENPSNEFELKADPNLKHEVQTIEFQKALIGLFIQAYMDKSKFDTIPAEALYCKNEWISTDANVVETFKEDFEFTSDKNDFVKSSDIEYWLTQQKLGVSMTKFTGELKKYITIHKLDIHNNRKKIGGKLYMCWFGIKRIVETAEDDDGYAESK